MIFCCLSTPQLATNQDIVGIVTTLNIYVWNKLIRKFVHMLCMDGPRCKFNTVKEQFSVDSINAPSAIDDKAAHSDCNISDPIIVLNW